MGVGTEMDRIFQGYVQEEKYAPEIYIRSYAAEWHWVPDPKRPPSGMKRVPTGPITHYEVITYRGAAVSHYHLATVTDRKVALKAARIFRDNKGLGFDLVRDFLRTLPEGIVLRGI